MARAPIPVFRLAGIRVTIDPSWFLIFLLVAWSLATGYLPQQLPGTEPAVLWGLGAGLALALFGSVIAHEFSHSLVARTRGVNVDEITLFIFGGAAKLKDEPRDATSEFLIAAAGPALSFALGAGILFLGEALEAVAPPSLRAGLWWLGVINVALAVFNLIPGFPLDGGRILRAILWWRTRDVERATVGAARTGQVIAALFMTVGALLVVTTGNWSWLWEVLIGWFLWSAATRSIRLARLKDAVEGVTVREVMTERVPAIRGDHSVRVGLAQATAVPWAGELAVIERDGRLLGVVSRGALEDAARDSPDAPAAGIASPPVEHQVIPPSAPAAELVERLSQIPDQLLLIVRDGLLLGTVDPRALVAALQRAEAEKDALLEP
ncbi:MAG TPA: site-2 protease family protein [Gemmatimonadota bacterium]|nr:site-2 protease family protein [Gemmatimonadota bacterium]